MKTKRRTASQESENEQIRQQPMRWFHCSSHQMRVCALRCHIHPSIHYLFGPLCMMAQPPFRVRASTLYIFPMHIEYRRKFFSHDFVTTLPGIRVLDAGRKLIYMDAPM